jgi:hypothetical protein
MKLKKMEGETQQRLIKGSMRSEITPKFPIRSATLQNNDLTKESIFFS